MKYSLLYIWEDMYGHIFYVHLWQQFQLVYQPESILETFKMVKKSCLASNPKEIEFFRNMINRMKVNHFSALLEVLSDLQVPKLVNLNRVLQQMNFNQLREKLKDQQLPNMQHPNMIITVKLQMKKLSKKRISTTTPRHLSVFLIISQISNSKIREMKAYQILKLTTLRKSEWNRSVGQAPRAKCLRVRAVKAIPLMA